ncbi:membrane protein FxsA, partial [Halobacteriales archaeon SW_8_68_21]
DAVGFLLALPLSRVPIRLALKKYVVVPYIEKETDGFLSGNVYIGGFPNDGEGGFTMGGGGSPGGGPDGFSGGDDGGATEGTDSGGAAADDDVVDVDFTVEDEEQKGTD